MMQCDIHRSGHISNSQNFIPNKILPCVHLSAPDEKTGACFPLEMLEGINSIMVRSESELWVWNPPPPYLLVYASVCRHDLLSVYNLLSVWTDGKLMVVHIGNRGKALRDVFPSLPSTPLSSVLLASE